MGVVVVRWSDAEYCARLWWVMGSNEVLEAAMVTVVTVMMVKVVVVVAITRVEAAGAVRKHNTVLIQIAFETETNDGGGNGLYSIRRRFSGAR